MESARVNFTDSILIGKREFGKRWDENELMTLWYKKGKNKSKEVKGGERNGRKEERRGREGKKGKNLVKGKGI